MTAVTANGSDATVSLADVAARVGREIAGPAADDVDRRGRFPHEAIAALRVEGLLGALVPAHLGGWGASHRDVADMCTALGRHCASTAMIFAMHHIQVSCIVDHAAGVPHFDALLREIATDGRLLASATSELGTGGDVRSSICAIEPAGSRFSLVKHAPVISYGEHVDDVLVTARRAPDAVPSDQVIAHVQRPDLTLERISEWDALGMRGTCSDGFVLRASGALDQIVPTPYADVSSRTMLPVSHIVWAAVWLGIAEAAFERAHFFVRNAARKAPGSTPPGARHLATAHASIDRLRALLGVAIDEFVAARNDSDVASSMRLALQMNNLKTTVSDDVTAIVHTALLTCGLAGYRNDSEYSIGRLLRDALSAPLMVSNDRIVEHNAALLCAVRDA